MIPCRHEGCSNRAEEGRDECFRHRVSGVGFVFRGGAVLGRSGFHTTQRDWMSEHLGVESEKQMAKRTDVEKIT